MVSFFYIAQAIPGNPFILDYLRQFAAEHEGQGLSEHRVAMGALHIPFAFLTRQLKDPLMLRTRLSW